MQTSHGSNKKTLHLRTYSTVLEALLPQLSTKSILVHKIDAPHIVQSHLNVFFAQTSFVVLEKNQ